MFKPFFHHYNLGPGKLPNNTPRGYTMHVKPDPDNSSKCLVSVAWCSPKDEFNKKLGRSCALGKEYKSINKRQLPGIVAGCNGVVWDTDRIRPDSFYWILKFVV